MRFYDDLLGDKIVVLDMMYADCTGVCPTITSNRVKAQKLLEARGARRFFHSITIKPEEDTPETLHEYADMHGVRGRWLFLTGRPGDVELLRHTLGHVDIIPAVDREKGRHSGIIRYGNEPQSLGRLPGECHARMDRRGDFVRRPATTRLTSACHLHWREFGTTTPPMPAEPVTRLNRGSIRNRLRLHPWIGRVFRRSHPRIAAPATGYAVAVLLPVAITLTMARLAWPAFIFEHLVVLLVVAMTIAWGVGPALVAAIVSVSAADLLLPFPFGTAAITGWHDGVDLALFVTVVTMVGWLVASARRERERAAQAALQERRAREDRDRLIATVSHDLATPLTAIVATVEFARRFNGQTGVDIPRMLLRLETAVARATTLLTMLRSADGDVDGSPRVSGVPLDMRDVVSPIVHMFEQVSARHSIALAMPAHPILIRGDREHLHRVVENLLSNAIKYSPRGGAIDVTLDVEDDYAVVGVRDHGIGISEKALPQIFQRRFRAPEAVTTAPGVGLGLSIAAEIIARHGGAIGAVNANPGVLVSMRVPLMSAADAVAVR